MRATAPGFEPATEQVKLGEGEEQTVTLVLKKLPPGPRPEVEPDAQPVAPAAKKAEPNRVPAWIAFGVGGAGLVVGTVTGVLALSTHGKLAEQCPNDICTPAPEDEHQVKSDISRYHTYGTISGVGFVVALAGAITGTVLLVTGTPSEPSPPKAALWPVIGPSKVGIAGRF